MRLSDKEIIEGIKKKDDKVVKYIYENTHYMIKSMVYTYGGNEADANDVFQDSLLLLFMKVSQNGFQLSSKFETFFYGLAKYIWINKKAKYRKENRIEDSETFDSLGLHNNDYDWVEKQELKFRIKRAFDLLPSDCRRLLRWIARGKRLREVADIMGISLDTAKKKSSACRKQLKNLLNKMN